ncbi:SCO1860 family LAETG-anchored protein [Streptomyces sp. SP18CS02]|uniref:SCO1860 family LAETG-anchored protein n=1 Tax=Streptomyces sp. SP18CS02 TaxID=3002531 RepID=UPI002E7777AF|nr:SCO1860 family LAETG-anchored protein [Streptomyces sp. SP18CS02]MEE1754827.1 SCO1860 family LAETG-anchored protein [Streptomyces sp. SP18CS02]
MNSNTFRMPARRGAAATAVMALAAGPSLLAAPAAHATGGTGDGRATAVVLRAGLDVSLLDGTVDVPLRTTLNDVRAPGNAEQTTLGVRLDGVDQGRPVGVLRADVATATATSDARKAEGTVNLAKAKVHVPGLPLLSLIEVEKVTSRAVCEAGRRPVAESNLLGHVTVLGRKVTLTAGGPTKVDVPGVGQVALDLSNTHTTSRTAAATALGLKVSVNPLRLNVAEVTGAVTLAEATCTSPTARAQPAEASDVPDADGVRAQSAVEPAEEALAETGGSSTTPYLMGGALALLAAGAGGLVLARRGRSRD